jgi:6-phosphogluconolactonase
MCLTRRFGHAHGQTRIDRSVEPDMHTGSTQDRTPSEGIVEMFAYVGGYTTAERDGRAEGITVFRTGRTDAAWVPLQMLATLDNPSLLRIAPGGRTLYAAHGDGTRLSAFAVDPVTGHLAAREAVDCGGVNPVDLGFVGDGRFVVTANYTSGTVGLLPVAADGALLPPCQTLTLRESDDGVAVTAASQPHGVTIDPTGRFVLVPDKGQDKVFVFRFDPAGRLVPAEMPYAACTAGNGPRHAVFHPRMPMLYVVNELGCSVQSFRWMEATGGLDPVQSVSTLPDSPECRGVAAEIAISADGHGLFASTRVHGSIVNFMVDDHTGSLGSPVWTSCQGREPRFFTLSPDGRALHVANQDSDTIVSFAIDKAGHVGAGTVSARVGSPSSICFARS